MMNLVIHDLVKWKKENNGKKRDLTLSARQRAAA
jgi:hypothetical protein